MNENMEVPLIEKINENENENKKNEKKEETRKIEKITFEQYIMNAVHSLPERDKLSLLNDYFFQSRFLKFRELRCRLIDIVDEHGCKHEAGEKFEKISESWWML